MVSNKTNFTLTKYIDTMLSQQEQILKIAREHQKASDEHHMQEFDGDFAEYPITSYVLYTPPRGKERPKANMTNDGPFQIQNRIGDIYTLENLLTGKLFDTHISALRPFNYDPLRVIPREVAMHNAQEFIIDRILAHRGNKNRSSQMKFLVRWLGFTEEHDSWEPYKLLRDTEQLIRYLAENKLKKFINKKYK